MNINFISPICNTSYGKVGMNVVHSLIKLEHKVSLFPIGQVQCDLIYQESIKQALENAVFFDVNAPCVRLWHQFDMSMFVGKGEKIGWPIFELDTFNERELHHLSNCDKLFVCSKWGKEIIKNNFYHEYKCIDFPIKVIPLGVDLNIYKPTISKRTNTIFLNIGKWEVRKGCDVLYKWFNEAFTKEDDVELWLMNYNQFYTEEQNKQLIQEVKSSKLGNKIKTIPFQSSDRDVANIMSQSDCGVFPSRAEGWGMCLLEMLSCGKHAIATNYSGHTEFCNSNAVRLVSTNYFEKAIGRPGLDDKWFRGQSGSWLHFDERVKSDFILNMRDIHELKQLGKLSINEAGVEVSEKFTWKNTVDCFLKGLE